MSYDFAITFDTGGPEPAYLDPDHGEVAVPDRLRSILAPGDTLPAFCANYTSNVDPMWERALTAALPATPDLAGLVGEHRRQTVARTGRNPWAQYPTPNKLELADLHDRRCGDLVPLLEAAVDHMAANPEVYRAINPPSGWGDYDGALRYLAGIECWCRAHPDGRLYLSY